MPLEQYTGDPGAYADAHTDREVAAEAHVLLKAARRELLAACKTLGFVLLLLFR